MCEEIQFNSVKLKKHVTLLITSFRNVVGQELINAKSTDAVYDIFNAPFVLLSHDTQKDPVFNFSNASGLSLFEYNWKEFTSTPSRYSAEQPNRAERERLLNRVNQKGYIDDYSGVRISKTGKRFLIRHAIVWNVFDEHNNYCGQAAKFDDWQHL